jgi:hypothetical protein
MGSENICGKLVIGIKGYYDFRIITTIRDWSNGKEYA